MGSMRRVKLGDVALVEISGVDKKTNEGEVSVRLCNYTDVYKNWAITSSMHDSFMGASANEREIAKFSLHRGQVAVTKDSETRDDIGIPTYIADNFDDVILGYHCALITPDETQLNGKYLNAFLHTDFIHKFFSANASGSGQRYTLSIETLNSIPIYLPSLEEQERIGNIFSSIDRKIELNRQINDYLEAIARQLYDYWFVQFDFPDENGNPYKSSGGEMEWCDRIKRYIPKGWSACSVGDILDKYPTTKRYETDAYLSEGAHPIIDQGDKYIVGYTNEKSALLYRTPAVVFGDHSTRVKYVEVPFARGADGTQILYSNREEVTPWYLFLCISNLEIPNPGYSRHFKYLKELPLCIPSRSISTLFAKIVQPLFKKWTETVFQNEEIRKERDYLLLVLMNGQVGL